MTTTFIGSINVAVTKGCVLILPLVVSFFNASKKWYWKFKAIYLKHVTIKQRHSCCSGNNLLP